MAGIALITNLDEENLLDIAAKTATNQGFAVYELNDGTLTVQKGNFLASIFLGAFIAYCDFKVLVEPARKGKNRLVLERNTPWWTGIIGISRVKSAAKRLMDAWEDEIEDQGGELLNRSDF